MLGFVSQNALLDVGKAFVVCVKVEFGFVNDLEGRCDGESFELLCRQIKAEVKRIVRFGRHPFTAAQN